MCNLTDQTLEIEPKSLVAYAYLVDVDSLISVSLFGSLADMGLGDDLSILSLPNIGLGLSPAEQQSAEDLLNSFSEIFSLGPHDFGLIKGTTHQLHLDQQNPICAAPYRKPNVEEAQVAIELKQLLEARLLRPSKSPWASPLLLIKKKDGGHQVVMDYWRLNSITKKDSYTLLRIDDSLRLLGGSKFFSAWIWPVGIGRLTF